MLWNKVRTEDNTGYTKKKHQFTPNMPNVLNAGCTPTVKLVHTARSELVSEPSVVGQQSSSEVKKNNK